jgi:[protein-PII] uridylyltransferase
MTRDDLGRGGTEVFIYTRDQDNLFALITSILDQLGLTILDARIITGHSGYTLDSFTVLEDTGLPIQDRSRIKEIVTTLLRYLQEPDATPPHAKPACLADSKGVSDADLGLIPGGCRQ